ncbi:MAG: alanine racemase [Leptospirillum sp.]
MSSCQTGQQNLKSEPPSQIIEKSRVLIDLGMIISNLKTIRRHLGPGTGILPVVKSDAYGHGMVRVSRALSMEASEGLAVMSPGEGMALRHEGINGRIVLMSGFLPGEWESVVSSRLTPVLHHLDQVGSIPQKEVSRKVPVHLKFDTGMGRLGFLPGQVSELISLLKNRPELEIEGIMTHFASGEDLPGTIEAWKKLSRPMMDLEREGLLPSNVVVHAGNSAAILSGGWQNHLDGLPPGLKKRMRLWVRPGLLLYGFEGESRDNHLDLTGCMKVESRLLSVRNLPRGSGISYGSTVRLQEDTTVGVVGMGYADGLPRLLSNRGWGYAQGRCLPFLGRVCMDMVMVNLGKGGGHRIGDWITILGNGKTGAMTAADVAGISGTIPYEILCLLGRRSPRFYHEDPMTEIPIHEDS